MTRAKVSLSEQRKRLQGQFEGLLEEMMIKLSSVVSNLLGSEWAENLKSAGGWVRGFREAGQLG